MKNVNVGEYIENEIDKIQKPKKQKLKILNKILFKVMLTSGIISLFLVLVIKFVNNATWSRTIVLLTNGFKMVTVTPATITTLIASISLFIFSITFTIWLVKTVIRIIW